MILRDDASAVERLHSLVQSIDAVKTDENSYSPEHGIVHDVTWTMAGGVSIYSAEDIRSGCTCVVILGENESYVASYAGPVKDYLQPLEQEELLTAATEEAEESRRARMVLRAGFGAPHQFDDRFFSVIRDAMHATSAFVRDAAIHATQYSFWPQYVYELTRVARADPEPLIREVAGHLAETRPESAEDDPGDET
jgi:hypothetical protein